MDHIKIKFVKPAAIRNVEAIKAALAESPKTPGQLAEIAHLTKHSLERYLHAMRQRKEIYRSDFAIAVRNNGRKYPTPIYSLGDKKDAVYKASTKLEHAKVYYQKLKADPDRYDRYLARGRNRNFKPKQQNELAHFFGTNIE